MQEESNPKYYRNHLYLHPT